MAEGPRGNASADFRVSTLAGSLEFDNIVKLIDVSTADREGNPLLPIRDSTQFRAIGYAGSRAAFDVI